MILWTGWRGMIPAVGTFHKQSTPQLASLWVPRMADPLHICCKPARHCIDRRGGQSQTDIKRALGRHIQAFIQIQINMLITSANTFTLGDKPLGQNTPDSLWLTPHLMAPLRACFHFPLLSAFLTPTRRTAPTSKTPHRVP